MEPQGMRIWYEGKLAEQGYGLWVGDAAQVRMGVVCKQKTDHREALHMLMLPLDK
jgi:hypothetical protein